MGPRILKLYDFPYLVTSKSTSRVPGKKIEFSSYPGTLYSNDDWVWFADMYLTLLVHHLKWPYRI